MSERMTGDNSGEASANSVGTGPVIPGASTVGAALAHAAAASADPAKASSESGETGVTPTDITKEIPKVDTPKIASKAEASKMEAPKLEAYSADTPKIDASRLSGKIMVMSPSRDDTWSEHAGPEAASSARKPGLFGKRRAGALAAVIALAAVAGALGGALATSGFRRVADDDTKVAGARALQDSVSQLSTEVAALRGNVEHSSKIGITQFNKTNERLDKVEKAQAEPAAKLAKITEAVERLRAAPAAATSAPAAAPRETTASISPPAVNGTTAGPVPVPAPKPDTARLPTVEGWVLRDVADGAAVIESRRGAFEVYAGDTIPGLGRVDAIRRQDGRWVVVTSKGLVVAR